LVMVMERNEMEKSWGVFQRWRRTRNDRHTCHNDSNGNGNGYNDERAPQRRSEAVTHRVLVVHGLPPIRHVVVHVEGRRGGLCVCFDFVFLGCWLAWGMGMPLQKRPGGGGRVSVRVTHAHTYTL
jgi:hypothetical protein